MKKFKEFLAEAGLMKALRTKKKKLLKKEEEKAGARRERALDKAMSANLAGTMQRYGASSPEAGRAALQSELGHETARRMIANIERLRKAGKDLDMSENYDVYLDMPNEEWEEPKEEIETEEEDEG